MSEGVGAGPGSVAVEEPAPGVIVFRMKGRMVPALFGVFEKAVAPHAASRTSVDLFFDTKSMDGYHPEFRQRMTAWHDELKPLTRSAHVYVSSKVIAMAIAVANMITGGLLESHTTYASFERALRRAVLAAGGQPSTPSPPQSVG